MPFNSWPVVERQIKMTTDKIKVTRSLHWESDNVFKIDDVTFVVETGEALYGSESGQGIFVIGKSRRQLETIQELDYHKPVRRIFDLGIYKGGSVMFYHKLFSPEKIVAVDLDSRPVEPLEGYIRNNGLDGIIRTYYGVNQADKNVMQRILQDEAGDAFFDLVVDDASHFLKETRISFNMLFPHVVPGGFYIIEDWGWAHWRNEYWQDKGGPWPKDPPLTNLVFEVTMLLASRPDLIESVYLLPAYAVIKRGPGRIDRTPDGFDLSTCYLNRGKKATLLS